MNPLYPLLLFVAACGLLFLVRAWWRTSYPLAALLCWIHGYHPPVRHPLGGFTCRECGHAGADLSAMGFPGGGYISSLRLVFQREHGGTTTRTTAFLPGAKGW